MVERRAFLTRLAAGLTGILASRRAPALAQSIRLHLLHRVDFIPPGEAELKRQLADYGRQMTHLYASGLVVSADVDVRRRGDRQDG